MQSMSFLKKTVIVGICVTPLVLSACGSKKEDSSASPSSSTSSVSAVAEQTGTSSSSASSVAPTSEGAPTSEAAPADAPEGEPAVPSNLNLENPVPVQQLAPVDGQPASDADRAAIDQLVRSFNSAPTLRAYMGNVLNNTCSRVIEANGGPGAYDLSQIPDMPLSAVPEYQNANPSVDAVDDVRVQGDAASASVTSTASGKTTTGVMRFHKEQGNWKLCD